MDLTDIEKKLESTFGLVIFDYLFLFNKKAESPKDISIGEKELVLREYIYRVNTFFRESGQPEVLIDEEKIEKSFYEAMHNLYLFRYMLGIKMLGEYEMVRIETWFENKMINMPTNDFLESIPITFSFKIPNTLKVDVLGNYDEYSTMMGEKETHSIKTYISSFAFGRTTNTTLFSLFENYTVKEFVPRLLEKEILDLCEKIMTKIGIYISNKVYVFLEQKFTLIEAKNNVLNLISRQLKSNEYFPDLEEFQQILLKTIKSVLLQNKSIYEDTAEIITNEFWDLFKYQFDRLIFFPENYFKIDFRKADNTREPEKEFSNIIDFYLLENDGTPWDMPVETYAIEFTEEAKKSIFDIVTNGFVNPNFTLTDFLYIYK